MDRKVAMVDNKFGEMQCRLRAAAQGWRMLKGCWRSAAPWIKQVGLHHDGGRRSPLSNGGFYMDGHRGKDAVL